MKKVLIVTYSYPPLNNIASRRFSELIQYLPQLGWKPYILTTNSSGTLTNTNNKQEIIRIGQHSQGFSSEDTSDKKTFKSIIKKFKNNLGFISKIIDSSQYSWYKKIKETDLISFKDYEFDLIIASYGPGGALSAGRYLSKELNVPWVADFRDLGALYKDEFFQRNFLMEKIDKFIEARLIKDSIAITTVSKALKEELYAAYKKPIEVIYNGWNRFDTEDQNKNMVGNYIYYAGSFYEHRMKSISLLLRSLTCSDYDLKIRSLGPKKFNDQIIKEASNLGVSHKVEILPPANPSVIKEEMRSALINLVLEDLSTTVDWKKGNLTGKFLSLLTEEAPILAIVRADSEIGEILQKTNKGVVCSTEKQVKNFLATPQKSFNNSSFDKIEVYSKRNQAKKLIDFLSTILK